MKTKVSADKPPKENLLGAGLLGKVYETNEAKRFPIEVFPEPIRKYVREQAKALHVPIDYVAVPMLVALGATIGRHHRLCIKRGYVVNSSLWAVVIGGSGSAKSPALKKVQQFLQKVENDYDRIIVSDFTMESLCDVMQQFPRGVILIIDEMSGWVRRFNRYRLGSDEQDFLTLWDGGMLVVDRRGRDEAVRIPETYLAMLGTIQPGPMGELITKTRIESGMSARLLLCYPEKMPRKYTEEEVPEELEGRLQKLFADLRGLSAGTDMYLCSEAKKSWTELASANCDELNSEDIPDELSAVWSKMESYAGRFILILHTVKKELGLAGEKVDSVTVEEGWKLVAYFKAHAWKVYHELEAIGQKQPNLSPIQRLRNWLRKNPKKNKFALRDILSAKIPGIMKVETLKPLLNQLAKEGLGKWSEDGKLFFLTSNPAPSNPADEKFDMEDIDNG